MRSMPVKYSSNDMPRQVPCHIHSKNWRKNQKIRKLRMVSKKSKTMFHKLSTKRQILSSIELVITVLLVSKRFRAAFRVPIVLRKVKNRQKCQAQLLNSGLIQCSDKITMIIPPKNWWIRVLHQLSTGLTIRACLKMG